MKSLSKALVVVLLQVLIVSSLGAKLLYDRAHRPRIWVRAGSFDPELPIRGRYYALNVQVYAPELGKSADNKQLYNFAYVELAVENGQLVARKSSRNTGLTINTWAGRRPGMADDEYFLSPSLALFLPEHALGPDLKRGDQIWAEVTVPKKGPPRPIQMAIKRGSQWIPLSYR